MELLLVFIFIAFAIAAGEADAKRRRVEDAQRTFNPPNSHGNARFADNKALRKGKLLARKGIPFGYCHDMKYSLHYPGFAHILTIAASRTGKGATLIINALLSLVRSCIVIDPKAENVAVTGRWRLRIGKVYVLNPLGMLPDALKGLTQARLNPMDIIDVTSASFHMLCDKIAVSLVWEEGKEGIHFTTAARMLVSGVIAALMLHGAPHERNLVAVAKILSGDIRAFCLRTVQFTKDPFVVQKLQRFAYAAIDNKEVNDVISTAITQLGFIGNAAIAASLSGSDFRFSDLARGIVTVYICLPLNLLDVCDKYFRLILETALTDLLNEGQRKDSKPVLAIVDEMAQLGPHMKSLENAMGMAAGAAGLQLWCVLQDLSQLKGMFPQTWETFIQNCGVTTWFGARDQTTREYVSKLSGTCEVLSYSRSVSIDPRTGEPHVNESVSQFGRPLLLPHEVGQLEPDEMIAFVEGVRCGPVRARRKFYFNCGELRGKYRDNPYVKNSNSGLFGWLFK